MRTETVVIKRFDNYFSAHIFQTKLTEYGIPAFIHDENTLTIAPFFSNALGQIKLVVAKQDEERAKALIQQFQEERIESSCPQCNEGKLVKVPISKAEKSRTFWKQLFFKPKIKHVWMCDNCGYEIENLYLTDDED
jgi:rubredoxin